MRVPRFAPAWNPLRRGHRTRMRLSLLTLLGLPLLYAVLAYAVAPGWWCLHSPPAGAGDAVRVTRLAAGLDGDPVNVALVGSREEVVQSLTAAGWYPADPTTLRTAAGICGATLLRRAYDTAPVSNLYLWGRKQDLAFERPVAGGPWQRHHVRFWRSPDPAADGRPLWLGAATFDRSVGFSHRTGQVTHHIAAEVDRERDQLLDDLRRCGRLREVTLREGAAPTAGRNGGGDRYVSDGNRALAVLAPAGGALAAVAQGR